MYLTFINNLQLNENCSTPLCSLILLNCTTMICILWPTIVRSASTVCSLFSTRFL